MPNVLSEREIEIFQGTGSLCPKRLLTEEEVAANFAEVET
jgi:hypothetical protein